MKRPLPKPTECDFAYDSEDPPELWRENGYFSDFKPMMMGGKIIDPRKAQEAARLGRIMPVGKSLQFFKAKN